MALQCGYAALTVAEGNIYESIEAAAAYAFTCIVQIIMVEGATIDSTIPVQGHIM